MKKVVLSGTKSLDVTKLSSALNRRSLSPSSSKWGGLGGGGGGNTRLLSAGDTSPHCKTPGINLIWPYCYANDDDGNTSSVILLHSSRYSLVTFLISLVALYIHEVYKETQLQLIYDVMLLEAAMVLKYFVLILFRLFSSNFNGQTITY